MENVIPSIFGYVEQFSKQYSGTLGFQKGRNKYFYALGLVGLVSLYFHKKKISYLVFTNKHDRELPFDLIRVQMEVRLVSVDLNPVFDLPGIIVLVSPHSASNAPSLL